LPGSLVRWLESKGQQATHVLQLELARSDDQLIWDYAVREGAVILSKDEDFARMRVLREQAVQVIWLRTGNCRTAVLLATMERTWPLITQQLDAGATLIEVF
jgi:predicted nuclease of predicted toxin-antitoxin system